MSGEGARKRGSYDLLEEGLQWYSAAELGMRLGVGLGGAEEEEGVLLAFLIICLVLGGRGLLGSVCRFTFQTASLRNSGWPGTQY